ncbi:MAG: hypothetical protein NTX97_04025 [Bacteroidetes bacterium]|nr:hypothetical protein [Bacteroidota bacterium]
MLLKVTSAENSSKEQFPDVFKVFSFNVSDVQISKKTGIFCDSIIKKTETKKFKNREKLISAFFAFPFPLGFIGAHRVLLGTKPWVPIVYVATFGGCFGVLPLIDFFVIAFSKDIEKYENNPHIFMWVK